MRKRALLLFRFFHTVIVSKKGSDFITNYAIFRVEKLKSKAETTKRQQHNTRSKGAALSDKTDTPNIKHITMPGTALKENRQARKTFGQFFDEKAGAQKIRKNACLGFEIVLSFSNGAVSPDKLRDWTSESLRFVADVFGAKNLYSATLHLSEQTPHLHLLVSCFDDKGKLNAHNIIKGPSHLRDIQTQYANRMARFGLQRGLDKRQTKAKHKACSDWYAEQSENLASLNAYKAVFGTQETWDIDTAKEFAVAKNDLRNASETPLNKSPDNNIRERRNNNDERQ